MKFNPIKKYFLFFASHPIFYSFLIGLIIVVIRVIIKYFDGDYVHGIDPNGVGSRNVLIFFAIIITHIILAYIVAGKYITRPRNVAFDLCDGDEWFRVLVTPDGQQIIINKTIWLKGRTYCIREIRGYRTWDDDFTVNTQISGKYKNATIKVPIKLTIELDGEFDKLEVFKALGNIDNNNTKLTMGEYVISVFKKFNDRNQDQINEMAGEYSRNIISEPELLSRIIDIVVFPERPFSNVKDVKICLGNPEYSSCKGMAC